MSEVAQPDPQRPPEGGDPVCWLHLVCESCGALIEREGDSHRPGCDAVNETGDERSPRHLDEG